MVFFSCDGCGDMLKKSQVDAHAHRCRRCQSVSCVDCNVSFYGDDYRGHTSCVSEVERYEKHDPTTTGSKKSAPGSTKRTPQQAWMDQVQASIDSAPAHLQKYLQTLAGLDNCPRKEKPFRNFAANSLALRGPSAENTTSALWQHLQKHRDAAKPPAQQQQQQAKNLSSSGRVDSASTTLTAIRSEEKQADVLAASSSNGHSAPTPGPPPQHTQNRSNGGATKADTKQKHQKDQEALLTSSSKSEKPVGLADTTAPSDLKSVKKAMKTVLKKAKDQAMSIKSLRKAVRLHLKWPTSAKANLKALVQKGLTTKKKFIIKDQTVQLLVEK